MRLSQEIRKLKNLKAHEADRMYELLHAHYDNMNRSKFDKDLAEKDGVVLLHDKDGILQGFSTYLFMKVIVQGKVVNAVFSGDSVVNKEFWGTTAPMQIMIWLFKNTYKRFKKNCYWYLISKGHRTYLLLPLLFKSFSPSYDENGNKFESEIIDTLSKSKFGDVYNEKDHLIYADAEKLKEEIAQPKRRNKHIDFFLKHNPEFYKGVELPCVAKISEENLSKFAMRYYSKL